MDEIIPVNSHMAHLMSHENRNVSNICVRGIIEERVADWDSDSSHSLGESESSSAHVQNNSDDGDDDDWSGSESEIERSASHDIETSVSEASQS